MGQSLLRLPEFLRARGSPPERLPGTRLARLGPFPIAGGSRETDTRTARSVVVGEANPSGHRPLFVSQSVPLRLRNVNLSFFHSHARGIMASRAWSAHPLLQLRSG